MGLNDFLTTQTLPLHILNDRIMPGVRGVHGDCKTVYPLKTLPVEWLTWHKCHIEKNKMLRLDHFVLITAGMTFRPKQQNNATLHFDAHYGHNGAGIKA